MPSTTAARTTGNVKKTLFILVIGIVLAMPAIVLSDSVSEREAGDLTASDRIGTEFTWPDDARSAAPEKALGILAEAADATDSNVIRASVDTTGSGRTQITYYVYLARNGSQLFHDFSLADGRWLSRSESRTGSATVSTAAKGKNRNVGRPNVLAHAYDVTFAPLHLAFDSLPVAGQYSVESADATAADRFLTLVCRLLAEKGMGDPTVESLRHATGFATPGDAVSFRFLPYALLAVAALLVVSVVLREGRRAGVMRLLGHSTIRIWYATVGRLLLSSLLVGLLGALATLLIVPGADVSYLRALSLALLAIATVGAGLTFIAGTVTINRIRVGDLVKGRVQ
jgi:hypothetical protein